MDTTDDGRSFDVDSTNSNDSISRTLLITPNHLIALLAATDLSSSGGSEKNSGEELTTMHLDHRRLGPLAQRLRAKDCGACRRNQKGPSRKLKLDFCAKIGSYCCGRFAIKEFHVFRGGIEKKYKRLSVNTTVL
jgi:hypothetical protein